MILSRTRIPIKLDSLHSFGRVSKVIAIPRRVQIPEQFTKILPHRFSARSSSPHYELHIWDAIVEVTSRQSLGIRLEAESSAPLGSASIFHDSDVRSAVPERMSQ